MKELSYRGGRFRFVNPCELEEGFDGLITWERNLVGNDTSFADKKQLTGGYMLANR